MRVVSMVPSWTETLLWAGVDVVGRTRFCLHPQALVEAIPIVGGTKDWILPKVQAQQPDLLILDKEENPRFMAEEKGLAFWASHVLGVSSLPSALSEMADRLDNSRLRSLAERWQAVVDSPALPFDPSSFPGVLEWGRRPDGPMDRVVYAIWRDPWMAVAPQTFIGSVLAKLGLLVAPSTEAYPRFDPRALSEGTLLLFSSEPYPFLRKREGLADLGLPYAFVDGEGYSWFGVRSLIFLERALGLRGEGPS